MPKILYSPKKAELRSVLLILNAHSQKALRVCFCHFPSIRARQNTNLACSTHCSRRPSTARQEAVLRGLFDNKSFQGSFKVERQSFMDVRWYEVLGTRRSELTSQIFKLKISDLPHQFGQDFNGLSISDSKRKEFNVWHDFHSSKNPQNRLTAKVSRELQFTITHHAKKWSEL